jgi:Ca2+-transporting ATPase
MASEIKAIDPMEQAFHRLAHCIMPEFEEQLRNSTLLKEYDMSATQLAVIHIWRMPQSANAIVAAKGAPETIMHLCKMRPDRIARTMKEVQYLAAQGLRVLAVANGKWPLDNTTWPEEVTQFEFEWGGLIGLADPLRIGVVEAIAECQAAGVRIVMITGDYPETARAIAKQAGLKTGHVMTGKELDAVSEQDLPLMLKSTQIFARMMPHHKLRLVQTLQEQGEIVAMTGDGVNDAPALKVAHIGISMGQRGSDVAREASSLVLLNDDFSSIVKTMRTGRLIVDNLRKALRYIIGVHLPIAGLALLPLFTGSTLILTPSLVMFLEMVINPTSSLVFENEEAEKDLMLKPPRSSTEPFFGSKNILYALIQGVGLLLACMIVFFILTYTHHAQEEVRATVFITIVLSNLLMMIVSRSDHEDLLTLLVKPNKYQSWVIGLTIFALILVLQLPWLAELFNFSRPSLAAVLLALSASFFTLLWLEIVKTIFARRDIVKLSHSVC